MLFSFLFGQCILQSRFLKRKISPLIMFLSDGWHRHIGSQTTALPSTSLTSLGLKWNFSGKLTWNIFKKLFAPLPPGKGVKLHCTYSPQTPGSSLYSPGGHESLGNRSCTLSCPKAKLEWWDVHLGGSSGEGYQYILRKCINWRRCGGQGALLCCCGGRGGGL